MLVFSRTTPIALAAFCTLAAGCASSSASRSTPVMASASPRSSVVSSSENPALTRTSYRPAEAIVREGMELQWSVQSPTAPANQSMGGKAVVGPDGAIELGPYGSVHVAGLTMLQAKNAAANQLGKYVTDAQVTLVAFTAQATRLVPEQPDRYPVNQTAWHPYQPTPEVAEMAETPAAEPQASPGPIRRLGQRVAAFWSDSQN